MKISTHISDDAAILTLGKRINQHRLERNLTQAQLASEAGVSKRTIERLEAGGSVQLSNFIRVLRALNMLESLDALIPEPPPSPIEQLKSHGKQRIRASSPRLEEPSAKWTWGDDT